MKRTFYLWNRNNKNPEYVKFYINNSATILIDPTDGSFVKCNCLITIARNVWNSLIEKGYRQVSPHYAAKHFKNR